MSLFRNVFISHKESDPAAEVDAPAVPSQAEDLAGEEALCSSISAEFGEGEPEQDVPEASVCELEQPMPEEPFGAGEAGAQDTSDLEDAEPVSIPDTPPVAVASAGQYDPLNRDDMAPKPAREQVQLSAQQRARALDPELVERAARAQSEIEKTQKERQAPRAPQSPQNSVADADPRPTPQVDAADEAAPAPTPAAPHGRNARRVRTRMLGFGAEAEAVADPCDAPASGAGVSGARHPVGWVVVTEGPGEGHFFALHVGVSTIGRGSDQSVVLDFGDSSISREKHAAIAYDDETNGFFLGHGGKSNIVRLNGRPVLSTEDLCHGDTIKIGETTLRFVALCGDGFSWGRADHA